MVDTMQKQGLDRKPSHAAQTPRKRSDTVRAFALIRRYHGGNAPYVLGFLMLGFEALTAILEPFPIAYAVDYATGERSSLRDLGMPAFMANERVETVLVLGLAIILVAAINKGADSLSEVFLARGGRALGYNIRVTMYDRLQKLPMAFHDKRRTGDVLTRVTGDVLVVEEFIVASLSNIVASALLLVGSFAVLLTQSLEVALIALVVVPILALVANYFSVRLKRVSKEQRSKEGDLASTAQEMLSSIRLVQSYGRGHVDLANFSRQSDQSMRASLKIATIQAQFSFVIAVLEGLTIAAVLWLSFWLVDRGSISPGTLVLFVLLIQNMFKPSRKIVSEWYKVGKLIASTDRIEELLERQPTVQDTLLSRKAPALEGRLSFDHVTFSYHSEHEDPSNSQARTVLHDITFDAAPGEVVALIGPSGAGKSSIAQLVPRLYDPDSGTGHPGRDGRARLHAGVAARPGQSRPPGDPAAHRHRGREHRLRHRRRRPGAHRGGGQAGAGARVHRAAARRVRDGSRRARRDAVRRPAPASGHRAGLHPQGSRARPRRADDRAGPGGLEPGHRGVADADRRHDDDHHLPRCRPRPVRRPHPRAP
jgi:ATP-binding cassette subfamily B protein